ncbi:MAG: hydroxymethylglutaryl-CoA lyase [Myxococcales bacterium]
MDRIYIQEVAVRDGFQIEPRFIPSEEKIAIVDALSATGLAKIEATAFVSPKAVPNLRDAEQVMRGIRRAPGVVYSALVPNARGAERAVACGVDEINLVMSASETHNRKNVNRSTAQSLEGFQDVMRVVAGTRVKVNGSVSTSFGYPFEGAIAPERVLGFAERYLALGFHGVTLADTTGMAHPLQVEALTTAAVARLRGAELTLHFHNTRGMGLANVLAALGAGARRFDASLGGLGGCPFAPGATGNICTEDVVHMLQAMGYDTGVDLDALLRIARRLPSVVGHEVPGQVAKAGKITDLHSQETPA